MSKRGRNGKKSSVPNSVPPASTAKTPATTQAPTAARTFRLYPEERHWWSMNDYGAVVDVMQELGAKRVLEFGPGSSTLSLIEGGAKHIDTVEDDPHWASVHEERMVPLFPEIVHLHRHDPNDERLPMGIIGPYDLALIDGPLVVAGRLALVDICLHNGMAAAVLIPIDDSPLWAAKLSELLASEKFDVEIRETGPLAGAFALVTRR